MRLINSHRIFLCYIRQPQTEPTGREAWAASDMYKRQGLEDGSEGKSNGLSTVNLLDYSVATSGTYRQTKPNPDSVKPASHLIDPRTGRPIEHNLVAVNVLAPTARDADALATALMILGPEEGMQKAEEMDLIARFCTRERNGTRHDHTTTWMHFFPATD